VADKFDALVLGAGFVGLGAALALQARGRSVALMDRLGGAAGETSFGNSGIVQSEAVYPYTFPRRPSELLAAALNRDPRAHIRHEALPALAPALWRYYRASAAAPRERSARGLRALVAEAVGVHRELIAAAGAGALIRESGWIKVFRTPAGLARGIADAEETRKFGVPFEVLDRDGLLAREPHMSGSLIGAVQFGDPITTSDPNALGRAYLDLFIARGLARSFRATPRRSRRRARAGARPGYRRATLWWRWGRGRRRWRSGWAIGCRSSSSAAITCIMRRAATPGSAARCSTLSAAIW
jgi:D-amino-acid dehydrogenase